MSGCYRVGVGGWYRVGWFGVTGWGGWLLWDREGGCYRVGVGG